MNTLIDAREVHPAVDDRARQRVFAAAEAICFDDLLRDPRDADRLHLRGLLALRSRQDAFAVVCLSRAAALKPEHARWHADLAEAQRRRGWLREAAASVSRAIALDTQNASLRCRLGSLLATQQRCDAAIAMFETALQIDARCVRAHGALGDLLSRQGRVIEARAHYEVAIRACPHDADAYAGLAAAHGASHEWPSAVQLLRNGIAACPSRPDLRAALGEALFRLGRLSEALECLRAASREGDRRVKTCHRLASILEIVGHDDDIGDAWFSVGEALEREGRLEDARSAYLRAICRAPRHLKAQLGLGYVSLRLGEPSNAIPYFESALGIAPDQWQARVAIGHAAALLGDLRRHWQATAWYDAHGPWKRRYFAAPAWTGSDVRGQTVLLWANAGAGHTLQMIRFADVLCQRGARVTVECEQRLVPLVRRANGVSDCIARKTPPPHHDVHALLTSLPGTLGIESHDIPHTAPYIIRHACRPQMWRGRLRARQAMLVGLRWGSERDRELPGTRSIPLALVEPFARTPGVRFVSLQDGPQRHELGAAPSGLLIEQALSPTASLGDVADLIATLDLVITVDSMVAHLAGALAVPVWTLLPLACGWEWHGGADSSAWYPTMRLFRQRERGNWQQVVDRVSQALPETSSASVRHCTLVAQRPPKWQNVALTLGSTSEVGTTHGGFEEAGANRHRSRRQTVLGNVGRGW
jgi:tetratricopeptide (TPR) repeat protein